MATVKRFGSCVGLGAAAGLADGEVAGEELAGGGLAGGGLTEGMAEAVGLCGGGLASTVAVGVATAIAEATGPGRGAVNRSTAMPTSTIAMIAVATAKRTRMTVAYYLAFTS
ncbi:MAG: hypothetical protein WB526_10680 [Candidatus Cybelea sp.]